MVFRKILFLTLLIPIVFLSGCSSAQTSKSALERVVEECESSSPIVNNSLEVRITNDESVQDNAYCVISSLEFDWEAIANRFNAGDESFTVSGGGFDLVASRVDDATVVFRITQDSFSDESGEGFLTSTLLFLVVCVGAGLLFGAFLLRFSSKFRDETLWALSVFGVLGLGFPSLLALSIGSESESVFWNEFSANGGPVFGNLILTAKIFTAVLVSTGFASIVLLSFERREAKRQNARHVERLNTLIDSTFPKGASMAVKKGLAGFAKSVQRGDLEREIEASTMAIRALLQPLHELRVSSPAKGAEKIQQLIRSVLEEAIDFQQRTWKGSLASSLQFEMLVGGDVSLDFGYHKSDPAFGESNFYNWRNQFACFDHTGGLIQVRGERLIIGCNIFQISSDTKVEAEQFKDEDSESIFVKVHDNRWALELSAEDIDVDDWNAFTAEVLKLLEAVNQVQRNLKVVMEQEVANAERTRLQTQYIGVSFGDWRAVRPIGNGGFGQVWLGEKNILDDSGPKQQAAIKVFSRTDFQSWKQFQAEMSSLAQLRHPNIAQLLDNAKDGNTFWFATSFVGESSLGEFVSEGLAVDLKRLQTYATQLFAALAHAHRRKVLHGDVHPGNLVLTNDQSAIVLVDFGLSTIGGLRTQEALTNLAYRAPELLADHPLVDMKNDVFSAAVTILTLAKGQTPWKSRNQKSLIAEMKSGSPSLAGLDESLARFIRPLLMRDPAKRPSASEVFNHLDRRGFHPW